MKNSNLIFRIAALISLCISVLWFDRHDVFNEQFGIVTPSFHIATVARFIIVAYVVFTMVAIGKLLLLRVGGAGIKGVDNFLAASVLGGSVIVVIVYVLGLSGLLYRWVLAVLLMGAVFCWPDLRLRHLRWPSFGFQTTVSGRWESYLTALLSVGLAAQIAYLLLWKGLVPSISYDVVSHYIPYYGSVIREHGTAINEFYWHFYEFKGLSFHFLAAVLADVQAIQLLVFCLVCIAAVALLKTVQRIGGSISLGLLAVAIFLGSTQILEADLQKAHLLIGVFIFLSYYFGHMLFEAKDENFRPLTWVFCVAIGTVSLLQTISSAYVVILLIALTITALCFRQYRLLSIFGIAMAVIIVIAATTMIYNYAMVGMYAMDPMMFNLKHGDKTRYLQHFSLTEMIFLMDFQPGNTMEGLNGLVNVYKAGGGVGVIRMLAVASSSSLIAIISAVAASAAIVNAFFYGPRKQLIGKLALIAVLAVTLIIALTLTNFSPKHFVSIIFSASAMGYRMGLGSILIVAVILLLQPFGTRQVNAALVAGILFVLGVGVLLIILGGDAPGRMTVWLSFFQALFFAVAVTFVTQLLARHWLGSFGAISATIALGLFLFLITNIKNNEWESRLLMPYLKGEVSYSEIYDRQGGGWAEYIRHHIPPENIVLSLDYCFVCESLPNMRWQPPIWNVYSDKTDEVWYGTPDIAAKILRERHVDYIVFNVTHPLFAHAFAPLFSPESIGKYFKVHWASPDASPYGKSYILTWRDKTLDNDSSLEAFMKDYQDKVILDRKTGNGFRDYLQLPLYGQKRFGSQWLWYAPMEDYNDYANSHNQR